MTTTNDLATELRRALAANEEHERYATYQQKRIDALRAENAELRAELARRPAEDGDEAIRNLNEMESEMPF